MFISARPMALSAAWSLTLLSLAPTEAAAQMMMQGGRMVPTSSFGGGTNTSLPQMVFNRGMTGQVSPSAAAFAALYPSFANPGPNLMNNPGVSTIVNPAAFKPQTNPLNTLSGLTNPYAALSSNPYTNGAGGYGANGTGGYGANGSGYGSSYYESAEGGYLRGSADLMTSHGKWLLSVH